MDLIIERFEAQLKEVAKKNRLELVVFEKRDFKYYWRFEGCDAMNGKQIFERVASISDIITMNETTLSPDYNKTTRQSA